LFHYGNVYADCSEWSYYEYNGGVNAVVTMTEAAPGHKLLWGTDGTVPEIFTGSAITSRKMLADALQRRVDSGSLPNKLMIPLAERILYKNAEKLYGMSIDA
jgi:predicted TIM-barrel fold metal-dependent hydrolase